MRLFTFRCPTTGLQVQAWTDGDVTEEADAFVTIACTACSGSHFVNALTGKVLGSKPRDDQD